MARIDADASAAVQCGYREQVLELGGDAMNGTATGYARLTVNLPLELKQRVLLICARRQVSMREYLTMALEERLTHDLTAAGESNGLLALTARADPVLAELWDNQQDAAYDRL
jgi:hypothetical protein